MSSVLYFRYHSTNCYFVRSSTSGRLLAIDAGWPGTLYEYARAMKSIGCALENIEWAIATHMHMDHAGLMSEFVERGITCFVFPKQLESIDAMEKTITKNDKRYKHIQKQKLTELNVTESRGVLQGIGIAGEIVVTDYHSADSVSFVSNDGEAVVGDLPPLGQMMPGDNRMLANYEALRKAGAKRIYPGHASMFELGPVR